LIIFQYSQRLFYPVLYIHNPSRYTWQTPVSSISKIISFDKSVIKKNIWSFSWRFKPLRLKYFLGENENRRFCYFLTLKIKNLMNYQVSRPLHRRKQFIVWFIRYPKVKGAVSTSMGCWNSLLNSIWMFSECFLKIYIELVGTKILSYIIAYLWPNSSRYSIKV